MLRATATWFFLIALSPSVALAADPVSADSSANVIRLSAPVQSTDTYEVFGAPMDDSSASVTLHELVSNDEQYLGREVLLTTRVAKVCQKKGCFFIAQDGDAIARVTFKDYGFFIPTDSAGKEVTLAGTFTRQQLSEAKARHYSNDLGEKPVNSPTASLEYQIVASSVRVPR